MPNPNLNLIHTLPLNLVPHCCSAGQLVHLTHAAIHFLWMKPSKFRKFSFSVLHCSAVLSARNFIQTLKHSQTLNYYTCILIFLLSFIVFKIKRFLQHLNSISVWLQLFQQTFKDSALAIQPQPVSFQNSHTI